ncbi:hypothetical protein PtrM4_086710 [Pyrenophora tritici-repentis]|uniref:Uncharacterized protein n=1 Tax=Pyrenophora tritici-repentis TaxID=45151 RepID=A0A834S1I4_9PLEO|nr:hypothetical protein PtrM4_086710 [Pyrenophora tritici-repentis]
MKLELLGIFFFLFVCARGSMRANHDLLWHRPSNRKNVCRFKTPTGSIGDACKPVGDALGLIMECFDGQCTGFKGLNCNEYTVTCCSRA